MNIVKYITLIVLLVAVSCKKSTERRCFKSAGDDGERVVSIDLPFDSLYLYDNIIYNLIPDTLNQVVFSGGENLLNFVDLEVNNNRLTIANTNRCNFLRSYQKKITANIHFEELNFLFFQGSEALTAIDTLRSNNFRMLIRDGAGSVNLLVNQGYTSIVVTHGYGDFTVKGKSVIAFLNCFTNSFCDAKQLEVSDRLIVSSNTQGDMHVNGQGTDLEARIFRGGNIISHGTPQQIELEQIGSGELIIEN